MRKARYQLEPLANTVRWPSALPYWRCSAAVERKATWLLRESLFEWTYGLLSPVIIEKLPTNKSAAMESAPLGRHLGLSKKEASVKKLIVLLLMVALPAVAQEEDLVATPKVTPVMTGLDNPRSLAFGPEGALYVVEAGRGGDGPCFVVFGANWCYGPSGRVQRLWKGKQKIVVEGLPSWARAATAKQPGMRAQGADGISFQGRGNMYVSIGWERRADQRVALAGEGGLMFDRLIRVT